MRYNYAYMPVVFEGYGADRDEIFAALKEYNIYARKYFYPCINDYACYREQFSSDDTPVAKRIASEVLTLRYTRISPWKRWMRSAISY